MKNQSKQFSINSLKEIIRESLSDFIKKDKKIMLNNKINEQSISHRIAVYLENRLGRSPYSVDCEYNKTEKDPKINADKKRVRPDIVIHKRGAGCEDNLAVFEVKCAGKNNKKAKRDIEKIMKYSNLNYKLGIFIGVLKRKIDVCWVEGNKESWEEIK